MKIRYTILISILITLSCSDRKRTNSDSQNSFSCDSIECIAENKVQNSTTISEEKKKFEKEEELSVPDYKILCEYLINNQNEAESEEIGYLLFEYFRENKTRNDEFSSFLSQKIDKSDKEIILCNLVQIMCIEIGEENYTYEKLIKDFKVFKDNPSVKKAFEQCLNNQVY